MAITIPGTSDKSGGCSTVSVAMPTGTASNDVMIMVYAVEDRSGVGSGNLPAGWTEICKTYDAFGGTTRSAWKKASFGETGPYSITGLDKNICVGIMTLRGADGTTPVDQTSTPGRTITSWTGPTTTVDGSMVFMVVGEIRANGRISNYANSTNPITWTEYADFDGNRDVGWCGGADGVSMAYATGIQSSKGSLGTCSYTPVYPNNAIPILFNIKAAGATTAISVVSTVSYASIKTISSVAIASVGKVSGLV